MLRNGTFVRPLVFVNRFRDTSRGLGDMNVSGLNCAAGFLIGRWVTGSTPMNGWMLRPNRTPRAPIEGFVRSLQVPSIVRLTSASGPQPPGTAGIGAPPGISGLMFDRYMSHRLTLSR